MADAPKIDHGGPAFPELGNIAYNSDWQSENGMTLRQYYAAHCPMTLDQAHRIWTDGPVAGVRDGEERFAFMRWWAQMRFEYADAMIAASKDA